jgi:hypothetical protein
METIVYLLCALTSLICGVMLWRGYARSRARLLFWSSICFFGFFLNNLLLIIDTRVVHWMDLEIIRILPAIAGTLFLIYGLVWESE